MALTIEVLAGMANRMRAMISAICLAEDLEKSLHVIWSANDPACMIRFQDLFSSGPPSWVSVDMGPLEGKWKEIETESDFLEWREDCPDLPIKSHNAFYDYQSPRWIKYLRALKPNSSIQEKLNHPFLQDSEVIGVHIRRGDHRKAREHSTTEAFLEAMRKESSSVKFIVATDSAIVKKELEAEFGDRLWFPAKSLTRTSRLGIQDALLDFLAISKCTKILGSYDSSFSELASLYGNVPLVVIKTS
jgi:hypothetical protein